MKRLLLSLGVAFGLLGSYSASAQCSPDLTAPAVTVVTGSSATAPIGLKLNALGFAFVVGDSGSVSPNSIAQVRVDASSSLSGSTVVVATATDFCSQAPQSSGTALLQYPKFTISRGVFNCNDVGDTIAIQYYAFDAANNVAATRTMWVYVVDVSLPTANVKPASFNLDSTGTVSITPAMAAAFNNGSSSVCPSTLVLTAPYTFNCSNVGIANPVTVTVTNPGNGQFDTDTTRAFVNDVTAPWFTTTAYTLVLGSNGTATLTGANVVANLFDACDASPTITLSKTAFACQDTGANTVTITIEDESGNTRTKTVVVTVVDNSAPAFTWLSTTAALGANGTIDLKAATSLYSVVENCSVDSLIFTPAVLNCSDLFGPTSVTVRVRDINGNLTVVTQNITAVDNIKPNAVGQNVTLTLGTNGSVALTSTLVDAGSTDNCSIATRTLSRTTFTCADVTSATNAAEVVYYTVTDSSGNSDTDTILVTVVDAQAPVTNTINYTYILYTNNMLNGEISIPPGALDPTSTDNCAIVSKTVTPRYTFNCNDVGQTFTLTVTNTDASGNSSSGTAQVMVVDAKDPVITVAPSQTIYLNAAGTANVLTSNTISATDECGIDSLWLSRNVFTCADAGSTVTITGYARDIHGNDTNVTTTITVLDTISPVVVAPADTVVLYLSNAGTPAATLAGTAASFLTSYTDICGVESVAFASPIAFGCADAGINEVLIEVKDSSMNATTVIRYVEVRDTIDPTLTVITSPLSVAIGTNGSVTIPVSALASGADQCGTVVLSPASFTFDCGDLDTNVVSITATDVAGNTVTKTAKVYVEDIIPPALVANTSATLYLNNIGQATLTNAIAGVSASDNDICTVPTVTLSKTLFTCLDLGTPVVDTITAEDGSGNISTAFITVTVLDTIRPTFDLLNDGDTIRLDSNGFRLITVPGAIGNSYDNCGVDTVLINGQGSLLLDCDDDSRNFVTTGNPNGLRQFTITSFDESGNSRTKVVNLLVLDLWAPQVYPRNMVAYLPASATGDASVTFTSAQLDSASSDPCTPPLTIGLLTSPTQIVPTSSITYNCDDLGNNTYFLKATDKYDNSAAVGARITVMDTIKPVFPGMDIIYAELGADGTVTVSLDTLGRSAEDNISDCGLTFTAAQTVFDCSDVSGLDTLGVNLSSQVDARTSLNDIITTDLVSPWKSYPISTSFPAGTSFDSVRVTYDIENVSGSAGSQLFAVLVNNFDNLPFISTIPTGVGVQGSFTWVSPVWYGDGTDYVELVTDVHDARLNSLIVEVFPGGTTAAPVVGQYVPVTATDAANNTRTDSVFVVVEDNMAPTLVRNTFYLTLGSNGTATISAGYVLDSIATDNCALDTTTAAMSRNYFDCSNVGVNAMSGSIKDIHGNFAFVNFFIIVQDAIAPVANAVAVDTLYLPASGMAILNAASLDSASFDNCGTLNFGVSQDTFTCADLGVKQVVFSVADNNPEAANISYDTVTLYVLDIIKPTIGALNPVTVSIPSSGSRVMDFASLFGPGATVPAISDNDTCGLTITAAQDTFTCANLGSAFNVAIYAMDGSGNGDTAFVSVTVVDAIVPNVVVNDTTEVYLDAQGMYVLTFADIDGGTTDNCDFYGTTSVDTLGCADVNLYIPVTGIVSDSTGNSDSYSGKYIIVRDTISPVFDAVQLAPVTGYNYEFDCFGLVDWTAATFDPADQNCPGGINVVYTWNGQALQKPAILPVGVHTIVTTATDSRGNSRSASFVATVIDTTLPDMTFLPNAKIVLNNMGMGVITPSHIENNSFDNCGIESVVITPDTVTCANIGMVPLTVVVTDINDNVRTFSTSIEVADETAPVVTMLSTAPSAVYLNASGQGSVTLAAVATVSDNCGVDTAYVTGASYDCMDLGLNQVLVTATDVHGNSTTVAKNVMVYDTISPALTTKSHTAYLNAQGSVTIPVSSVVQSATDNCAQALSSTVSMATFTCGDLGPNSVSVTTTDASGNSTTKMATVTVLDTTRPSLNLSTTALTLPLNASGTAMFTSSMVVSSYGDNCSVVSITLSDSTFTCADLGAPQVVNVTALDQSGNYRTKQVTITLVDNISPTVVMSSAPYVVVLPASGSFTLSQAAIVTSAADNCSTPTISISPSSVSCADLGSVTVVATITDASGNVTTSSKTIQVVDQIAPVISAPTSPVVLALNASGTATLPASTASATDNCGPVTLTYSNTSFSCSSLGANTVTVTATDASGNQSTATVSVTVVDNTNPTLTLISTPVTVALNASGVGSTSAAQLVANASDNCNIASITASPTSFTCADLGANTITVVATDGSGNSTTQTISVTVVDNLSPVITVSSTPVTVALGSNGVGTLSASQVVAQVVDNCTATPSVTISPTTFTCADLGAQTVTIFAADANGNISTTTAVITVVDQLAPVIVTSPSNVTLPACNATLTYNYQVTDNCSYTSVMTSGLASGSLFPVGITTVTWVFTDPSGNSVTHSFNVQVDPLGTYTLPNFGELCLNAPITDLVAGQSGLVFSGPGVVAGGTGFYPQNAGVGVHTLNYVYTDGNGCIQNGTITMEVLPLPQKPVVQQIAATTLSSSVTGATYQWYRDGAMLSGATNKDLQIFGGGNYEVAVFNAEGCSRKSNGFVIGLNGLGLDDEIGDVRIYPNPTRSTVTFEASFEVSEDVVVTIIDMRGAIVYEGLMRKGERTHMLDMSSWASAPYQVRFMSTDGSVNMVARIIKID